MRAPSSGPAPYGYRVHRPQAELIEVREEQGVLWLIAHLRRRGWALQRIADQLDAFGIRTRAGVPFSAPTLHSTLRRMALDPADDVADTG